MAPSPTPDPSAGTADGGAAGPAGVFAADARSDAAARDGDSGGRPGGAPDLDALAKEFERALLGGERKFTRRQVSERAGISTERAERMWRALGFATVPDDELAFTDDDVEALRLVAALEDDNFIDPAIESSLARKLGQTQSRLASWQSAMFLEFLAGAKLPADEAIEVAGLLLPAMERLQTYVWRRHLAAAAGRAVAGSDELARGIRCVGFADIVSYTRLTRRLSEAGLGELIERFEGMAADVVALNGGRVIKSIGDEVLFVTDTAAQGAAVALALQDEVAATEGLPELRIGLAYGSILIRLGDVYGETVNLAARLTSECKPGRVLADRELAAALDGHSAYRLRRLRRVSVRGYHHLTPYALQRAAER
ncbi:adenylate/guanylate cyclase [Kribbella flavida DSM 17836]|uniref:Adenylate/guanylate cyclase n=1 Tax=Kribbella flavida (strain DSM 17836 / JCM 10339 / NBRC 14399) TaxID=479435 RepID=D2PTC5_KRIFD|nr:adenylate/guanylate cyclase domain-containing protein [Kribbella flavida]ADB29441.1 adenylate/guanylate cyclase [Kribbella flavida DSM 17836]